jgi:DNA-binding FadR family transcriptional regulator
LREAYRVLESESLISVRRGARGGARVHVPSIDVAARNAGWVLEHRHATMADIYQARTIIEVPCAARLARTRTREQLDVLWSKVVEAEAAMEEPDRFIRLHTEFHGLVVDMAGNQTLAVVNGMVRHLIDLANWTRMARDPGGTSPRASHRGAKAHRRLVEYIEAQDPNAAAALWRTHLVEADSYLLEGAGAQTVIELLG